MTFEQIANKIKTRHDDELESLYNNYEESRKIMLGMFVSQEEKEQAKIEMKKLAKKINKERENIYDLLDKLYKIDEEKADDFHLRNLLPMPQL